MTLVECVAAATILALGVTGVEAADGVDWGGFYAGVGIGGQRSHATIDRISSSISVSTVLAGGTGSSEVDSLFTDTAAANALSAAVMAGFGVQVQEGAYIGVEAELDPIGAASLAPRSTIDCFSYDLCVIGGEQARLDTLGRARVILGAPTSSNMLVFGALGLAVGQGSLGVDLSAYVNHVLDQRDSDYGSSYLYGGTLGAGVDIKATENLRIRLEALVDLYPTAVQANGESASVTATDGAGSSIDVSATMTGTAVFSDALVRAALLWDF